MHKGLNGLMCKRRRGGSTEPTTWTKRQNADHILYDLAYDGSTNWVVSGCDGIYKSATPASSWTWVSNIPCPYTDAEDRLQKAIMHDGTNFICTAWEYPENHIYSCTDPTSWTSRDLDPYSNYACSIASNGTSYYAAICRYTGTGAWSTITATSVSGTWTTNSNVMSVAALGAASDVNTIAYGNSQWVATGYTLASPYNGKIAYCDNADPTNSWSLNSSHSITNQIYNVAYGNGYWVAVGWIAGTSTPVLAITQDPTGTWINHTTTPPFTSTPRGIHYANETWVAVGNNGEICTCGKNPTGIWTRRLQVGSDAFTKVSYGNNLWVAIGTAGIYTAPVV